MRLWHSDRVNDLIVERDERIGVITLNRPDRLNALLPHMLGDYAQALGELDADPGIRAIVVTGAGRGFCAGADLSVLDSGTQALQGYMDGLGVESLPTRAFSLATPVVTAVNGPCVGIGMLLALCADVRVASPSATFASAFSRLGLVAEYGMAWVLPRLIGLGAATEVLLSGRAVTAAEAATMGMVTQVSDDPVATARAWAADVAAHVSPDSIRAMKAQLLQAQSGTLGEAVQASLVAMRASVAGPDLAEALNARRDGRAPEFTGGSA